MLTSPVYKGCYRYRPSGQEEILIPVPPIVDEPTWQAAQVQLTANSLYSSLNNRRHQYLLRGLVRCPRCGGTYTGYTRRGYSAYRCNRVTGAHRPLGRSARQGPFPHHPWEKRFGQRCQVLFRAQRPYLTDTAAFWKPQTRPTNWSMNANKLNLD